VCVTSASFGLISLCDALVHTGSDVADLKVDLAGNDALYFPATSHLLRMSKGSFTLACTNLHTLVLRFDGCAFGDRDYAALFQALIPCKTLAELSMEIDHLSGKAVDRCCSWRLGARHFPFAGAMFSVVNQDLEHTSRQPLLPNGSAERR
jgi:hypothetical protein